MKKTVTQRIHDLYDLAFTQKDFRTMQFLDWFIREQGEEEKSVKNHRRQIYPVCE